MDTVHSELRFTVDHLVIAKISGRFTRWVATVMLDAAQPQRSSFEVVVDAASIDTGNGDRDGHLRSEAFLDVQRHPAIRFRSGDIVPAGDGDYLVTGELTLRGITRRMTLFVSDRGRVDGPDGRRRAAFVAHGGFKRREFGMFEDSRIGAGNLIIGDTVEVNVEAEATEGR